MVKILRLSAFLVTVLTSAFSCLSFAGTLLTDTSYYTSAVASSTFVDDPTYGISNVFDNNVNTEWASFGNDLGGNNPQGNQEVWFSFALDQSYLVDAVRFLPRQPNSMPGDFITGLKVWIGETSFGVDVQSETETAAFLSDPLGGTPTLNESVNFPDNPFVPQTYSLPSPVQGQFFLVQLATDEYNILQNIGAREFVVSVVPEPSALSLLAVGLGGVIALRRARRRIV